MFTAMVFEGGVPYLVASDSNAVDPNMANIGSVVSMRPADRFVYVDVNGVLRWQDTKDEVALFGVNYCASSGYSYRALGYVGALREKAIEQDCAHFARMGFDFFRISFWGDWECSDREGNLVNDDHIKMLDYLISQARMRGIYVVLTPIVVYNPAWPESQEDKKFGGFSEFYTKAQLGTDANAIKVQQNYWRQIVSHINRYTGRAYKDEPAILAFELINEPINPAAANDIKEYVNTLARAIRDTGCNKPIFYNASQGICPALTDALSKSEIDGTTWAWYPTGLVNGWSLPDNCLPKVDDYPQMLEHKLAKKAKLVYEFDAPDIAGSYMYPAMARTFRRGGMQCAAMFSYDPLVLAPWNVEYQTHYVNLLYAPNKAISLMIAGEVFRNIPRNKNYGEYPQNTRFGPFRVSYEENLSEMVTDQKMLYSNDTNTLPPNPETLTQIAGCGSSAVIRYNGTGCYFLDKLEPGLWRLEVYPDAVWVNDPFGRPSLGREVSRLIWQEHAMSIAVPDLGQKFVLEAVSDLQPFKSKVVDGKFDIRPGVYFLKQADKETANWKKAVLGHIRVDEFVVPPMKEIAAAVSHKPPREVLEDKPFVVNIQVASAKQPDKVVLYIRSAGEAAFKKYTMKPQRTYQYWAELPAEDVKPGTLQYCVILQTGADVRTFPADTKGEPNSLSIVDTSSIKLFDAKESQSVLSAKQRNSQGASVKFVKSGESGAGVLQVAASGTDSKGYALFEIPHSSLNISQDKKLTRYGDAVIKVRARSLSPATTRMNLIFSDKYGMQYPVRIPLETSWKTQQSLLSDFCIVNIDSIRVMSGQRPFSNPADNRHGFEIESISVEPPPSLWQVNVVRKNSEIVLFEAQRDRPKLIFPNSEHSVKFDVSLAKGMSEDKKVLRIGVPSFRAYPHDVSCRLILGNELKNRNDDLNRYKHLRVRIRGTEEITDKAEIALIEQDRSAWGVTVPLTTKWNEVIVPTGDLHLMTVTDLPRPYPTIFEYWQKNPSNRGGKGDHLDLNKLEAIQISFGGRLFPKSVDNPHAIEVETIALESGNHNGQILTKDSKQN